CAPTAPLLATYAYLGREQALEELKQKLFGSSACPIKTIMYWWPYKETHDAERLSNGLRKAGLE
ncbi:MAG: hypothetical protein ACE5LB_12155, partial [Acidiferrobacterales bacterium]